MKNITKNDNSLNFWTYYYSKNFKEQCEKFNEDYKNKLKFWLAHHKNSYDKRDDKGTTDIFILDSIKGQCNQIKALEKVLEGLN